MTSQPLTPVVIGVGDVINRSTAVSDAIEPRRLIVEAIRQAMRDVDLSSTEDLRSSIDSVDVVASWTWPYDDLPGLISHDLRIDPKHTHIPSYNSGSQPARLFDEAAKRIASSKSRVAVVCGGEALASLAACARAQKLPPPGWTTPKRNVQSVFSPTTRDLAVGLGAPHMIGAPIHVYPLYENAFRAHRRQSISANHRESADLYAGFAQTAERHEFAWNYGRPAETAQSIGEVSPRNRMICFPYPLLMNAFNTVNVAAACILTSTTYARELGVTEDKWIYPLGGAGTRDSDEFWKRPNYYTSPCIARSLDAALHASGVTTDDIDLYDFYSCFPIVPKLACAHLGLSILDSTKAITLLGGLTSFGGAGNNYSMHALTEMVRQLRKGNGTTGLVLANGGMITYQHALCLSSRPRRSGAYPCTDPLPDVVTDVEVPMVEDRPEGDAVVETYTVEFGRDGKPSMGHVVGRLPDGRRFLANHGDDATLLQLASQRIEPIGRRGFVTPDQQKTGRNLFVFTKEARL